jgi:hypothetical protein
MKKLLLFCLLPLFSNAQLPSIGEIYNYNVGDTFLYKLTDLNTNQIVMYVNRVVLSRDNSHFPDSLIYTIEETFLDTNGLNPAIWDTVTKVFYNCDDTIFPYNGFISCQEATDSCSATSAVIDTTDPFFPGLTVYHADFNCQWWSYGWNNAAAGLGIVHAYNGCGDFVLEQYDILLVHWYKAPSGISENSITSFSKAYPNPASGFVTIEFENTANAAFSLQIMNLTGRVVEEQTNITTGRVSIKVQSLASGIYHYRLLSESMKQRSFDKLIVE